VQGLSSIIFFLNNQNVLCKIHFGGVKRVWACKKDRLSPSALLPAIYNLEIVATTRHILPRSIDDSSSTPPTTLPPPTPPATYGRDGIIATSPSVSPLPSPNLVHPGFPHQCRRPPTVLNPNLNLGRRDHRQDGLCLLRVHGPY
jgi:hypothetical protein